VLGRDAGLLFDVGCNHIFDQVFGRRGIRHVGHDGHDARRQRKEKEKEKEKKKKKKKKVDQNGTPGNRRCRRSGVLARMAADLWLFIFIYYHFVC
jgi:hypothetical protein